MAGRRVHVEIPADDTAASRQFWGSLFGWEFTSYPGPSEYHMTRLGDQQGAAITNMEPGKQGARVYFDVEDITDGAARVASLGGQASAPMPVPGMGWFATCTDPAGNEFGLWQTTKPRRHPANETLVRPSVLVGRRRGEVLSVAIFGVRGAVAPGPSRCLRAVSRQSC